MALIALTTDFGSVDPFVGIMKGVLAGRAPGVPVVDVTHGIPPQDVLAGALVLRQAAPYFPPGTIHLAVVDPGVGSARRALCVETATALFVGPDNGLLSLATPAGSIRRIVQLSDARFFLHPCSATFHGRDVFAPVAAALATGTDAGELGPTVPDIERLQIPEVRHESGRVYGQVIYVDHFGNLITNVPEAILATFPAAALSITISGVRLRGIAPTYAAGQPGQPVAVVNSWGLLEVAVPRGSARVLLGAKVDDSVLIEAS
jgi:S-adenosylmethionine hydrolase